MLWFCPCCMSPLHVPATCPLSVHYTPFCQRNMSLQHAPAIWPIVSGHLNCSLFQPIGALFDRELFTNSATGFTPTEMNMTLFTKSGQWAHLASSVLVISWESYKVPSIVLYLANFKPVFISQWCFAFSGRLSFHIYTLCGVAKFCKFVNMMQHESS